jgi:glycosyltransferase involved in cell wall biosynthesis
MMVSIIIPIYNVEKYISECIESILNQTYKEIEIILINDGSTDLSGSICDSFQEKHTNIIVIHQKNSGSGNARNNGLDIATGEFIMFCDPDDWLPVDAVEKHVEAIENNNADLTIGFIKDFTFDNSGTLINKRDSYLFSKSISSIKELKENFFRLYSMINFKSPCNKLYRAEIIKQNKLRFPNLRRSQDIVFNNEYLKCVEKVEIIGDYVYNRRIIKYSIYSKLVGDFATSRVKVYDSFKNLLSHWNIESNESKRFLNKVLFEIIWSYYGYIVNNPNYSFFKKMKLMDENDIKKLRYELKINKYTPFFDNNKARLLYFLIYYNFKVTLIILNSKNR